MGTGRTTPIQERRTPARTHPTWLPERLPVHHKGKVFHRSPFGNRLHRPVPDAPAGDRWHGVHHNHGDSVVVPRREVRLRTDLLLTPDLLQGGGGEYANFAVRVFEKYRECRDGIPRRRTYVTECYDGRRVSQELDQCNSADTASLAFGPNLPKAVHCRYSLAPLFGSFSTSMRSGTAVRAEFASGPIIPNASMAADWTR